MTAFYPNSCYNEVCYKRLPSSCHSLTVSVTIGFMVIFLLFFCNIRYRTVSLYVMLAVHMNDPCYK